MSKNHPHDNIYSILGKLAALQPTPEEKRFAIVKEIRESVEAQGSILSGVDAVQAKLAKSFAESKKVDEVAADMPPQVPGVAPQAQVSRAQFQTQKPQAPQAISNTKYGVPATASGKTPVIKDVSNSKGKLWALRTGDGQDNLVWIYGTKPDPACTEPVKAVFNGKPVTVMKMPGTHPDHESRGYIVTNTSSIQEATCNECGMYESKCSCDHTNEGKVTHPEKGVTRHTKTEFPGYPADDIDDLDDLRGPGTGKRGRPRKHAKKEPTGLGRGRPKKDKPLGHNAPKMHDPFGRVGHSAEKKATVKGRVHSMDESMSRLERRLVEGLNFKQMAEETDLTIDELMSELQQDILSYKKTGHCSDKLGDFLKVHAHGKKQREMEEAAELEANVTPIRPGIPRNNAPQPTVPPGSGPTLVPPAGGIHGNFLDPMSPKDQHTKLNPPRTLEEINPIEEELAKLAELAGITMGEGVDKTKFAALAEPKDEITYADKIAGAKLHDKTDEEVETEGNRFGKEVSDAKADGIQPGEKITVGGKEYPVKEETTFDECGDTNSDLANALLQMLRIAGLGGGAKAHELEQEPVVIDIIGNPDEVVDEADAPYDEGNEELANAPNEEYQTMRQSTMNPGEADNGEKAMHPDRPTFKNGDNALAKPANEAVIKLEAKLAAEYESIKKVSK